MVENPQGEVTELLAAMNAGNKEAKTKLFDLVYQELLNIAGGKMRWEREEHTLQPTALVHEAYLKLFPEGKGLAAGNRPEFFAAAVNAMRQVLVDHARKRNAEKHGGNLRRVPFDDVLDELRMVQRVEMLDLDEALSLLEQRSTRQHEVVMLRFFSDLKYEEIAGYLKVSVSTVEKDWHVARAWLYGELRGEK